MKKILLFSCVLLTALVSESWAQERTISGKVTSVEDGSTFPGVNVVLKGTTTGTITDVDGNYTLSVPSEGGTLTFSFIGLANEEVEIGARSVIDIAMSADVKQLSEVVVTALGMSREKASLGYGVTSVSSDDIQSRPEVDVARVLRGKVPGVDIASTSGIAGSGTSIIIRGFTSISGNNQPLFVIDGVPFNTDTNNDRGFSSGGATASSRFLDLDPNNIANISILKGLSATVLYGESGRNGVVLVTTKTGQGGANSQKKMEISFNQSYNVNEVADLPEDQDKYGNGWQNAAAAAFSNWGAPFDQPNKNGLEDGQIKHPYDRNELNVALPQYVEAKYDYKAYDNLQDFFVKGSQVNTSINISSALSETSSVSVSYGYLKDGGYVPNNEYVKHNLSAGFNTELDNGLTIRASTNFIGSETDKPAAAPIFSSNPRGGGTSLFSNVLYTPRSIDLHRLEFENPLDQSSIYYRGGNDIQHPLWTLNNANDNETIRRFFGNVTLGYDLTDWLSVSYRMGVDTYTQQQDYTVNRGGVNIPDGLFVTSGRLNLITDQVLNFSMERDLSSDINLQAVLGMNLRRETRDAHFVNSTEQFIFDLFNHNNFVTTTASTYVEEKITNAVYAQVSLGYKDFAYINLQARNDWTSLLEKENRSILYPSASLSFLPMDAFGVSTDMVNNLKLRVSYGTSAGYPGVYRTRPSLGTDPSAFQDADGTVIRKVFVPDQFPNPELKPEVHKEVEIGIEGSFIRNKLGIDLSLYKKNSTDLIIDLDLDPSTGFGRSTVNSAELENKGIELGLNGTPLSIGDFNWNVAINFTKNISEVVGVADGIDQILIPRSGGNVLGNFAIPGQPYGIIKGSTIQRDADGNPILNSNGTYQGNTEVGIIGDPNPNYQTSLINTLSYKFLSLRVQVDYRDGGDIYGSTASTLTGRGIAGETDFDRFVPVITTGVLADGTVNTKQITSNRHYWENTGIFYDEQRVFDGSTVRLREVSLTVTAPKAWLSKTPFGTANLTFAGQNLWYRAINFPQSINFDPEVLSTGVGNSQGFDFVTGPTSRKYGATLSLTF